ncbi:MAG: S8 family peptidase [Verrucomicrobia bacterium]|nr:S8 family peptidase [Verrucomicrobiota bacterium]
MPESSQPLIQLRKPSLKHLFLPQAAQRLDFKGKGGGKTVIREVERRRHAGMLNRQLRDVARYSNQIQNDLPDVEGIVVEVTTAPGFALGPTAIQALTARTGPRTAPAISLLHAIQMIDADGKGFTRIVLHVPFGGLTYLEEKLRQYSAGTGTAGNHAYLGNILSIAQAALAALWTDPAEALPKDDKAHWWQLWIRKFPSDVWLRYQKIKAGMAMAEKGERLELPEHFIVLIQATYAVLAASIPLLDCLAEVRGAHPCSLGLTDLSTTEQSEYVDEALTRIRPPPSNAPAVCLLDTGVTRGHRLLAGLLAQDDIHTVFPDGDGSDAFRSQSAHGHGTPMAGLAAYGDLRGIMEQVGPWDQNHRLESVRVLDPTKPHEPENYGSITTQAIALPEIKNPHRKRVYSLAMTAPGPDDGRPTAWSAAVDAAAYGDEDDGSAKRVIVVSAGNVQPDANFAYPDDNRNTPIEDPAHAWNAVTVGAMTHRDRVTEPDPESRRLVRIARQGDLSPFSRTSCEWDEHWPLKPEIVMEGGNAAIHPDHGPDYRPSLELISTSAMAAMGRELCAFNATSAATAQAARLAAEITARYPAIRAETVRGLLVHSARWNNVMLGGINPHRPYTNQGNSRLRFIQILRSFGFGEPDSLRSHMSADHAVTMIREDKLQPYTKKNGSIHLNDCHVHILPWPKTLLQQHFDSTLRVRVTLSFFTAPNPSANNALGSSRYRYGGCLLRFIVRHKDEAIDRFDARLKGTARENDEGDGSTTGANVGNDTGWALGPKLCGKAGSLVQDIWEGPAAHLLTMDRIAVYPAKGWWAANRKFPEGDRWHNCHELPIHYSLIVSLEAQQDIPLYTSIQNLIQIPLDAS